MKRLSHLLDKNQQWARKTAAAAPDFFPRLAERQQPEYLWIGCSDSRVPASRIVDLLPGEAFTHRNIANLVQTRDLNCQAVIQFAVETLQVNHIIVCGHYGCGGVLAAMSDSAKAGGLVEDWIGEIKLTRRRHEPWLAALPAARRADAMCELNVIEQARALSQNRIILRDWRGGRELDLHGWIYNLRDGRIHDLDFHCGRDDDAERCYAQAIERIKNGRA